MLPAWSRGLDAKVFRQLLGERFAGEEVEDEGVEDGVDDGQYAPGWFEAELC